MDEQFVLVLALIGSVALRYHTHHLDDPKDIDVVGDYDSVMKYARAHGKVSECYPFKEGSKYFIRSGGDIIEAEIAWEGSSGERLIQLITTADETRTVQNNSIMLPGIDVLYMLKMSHRFLRNSPFFLKTMNDIIELRKLGAKIPDEAFLKDREKATYTYEHPKLNVKKDDFFTGDGVQYVYPHDDIHKIVAHLDQPAYKFYQPENSQVHVMKEMFFAQPRIIQLLGVLEEAEVLSLERSQIPFRGKTTPRQSFDMALMKVCTSITSGFFREFAWENYHDVQRLYDDGYVVRFWKAVVDGIVIPYQ